MNRRALLRERQPAQSMVAVAIMLPVVLVLLQGLVGLAVVVQAELGLVSVAQEAAHAAALAPSPTEAVDQGEQRGQEVASGFALHAGELHVTVDASQFGPGGRVQATAQYQINPMGLPILQWVSVPLERRQVEPVARYRSLRSGTAP
jgi:Flp pilus assembly protein TadG